MQIFLSLIIQVGHWMDAPTCAHFIFHDFKKGKLFKKKSEIQFFVFQIQEVIN